VEFVLEWDLTIRTERVCQELIEGQKLSLHIPCQSAPFAHPNEILSVRWQDLCAFQILRSPMSLVIT
jgi:hypothetical protein